MTSHNQDNCPICQSLQPLPVEVTYHDGDQTVDPSQPAEITSVTIWPNSAPADPPA